MGLGFRISLPDCVLVHPPLLAQSSWQDLSVGRMLVRPTTFIEGSTSPKQLSKQPPCLRGQPSAKWFCVTSPALACGICGTQLLWKALELGAICPHQLLQLATESWEE